MPAPLLPPPAPVPVSAETRLAYVLQHFALAYPGAPAGAVGYAGTRPAEIQVEIADLSDGFFNGINPYPSAPRWREWQGQQIPFFFDNAAEKPLLIFEENKVFISADIISAAFYLLSGWQEYFSLKRDQYRRFPYAASVQKTYNFVTLPVVNYYFDVLRTALEHASGQALAPRRWGSEQAEFAAFISHDVDRLYSAWKAPAKAALQQGKFGLFGQRLWQHLTQPDAWNNPGSRGRYHGRVRREVHIFYPAQHRKRPQRHAQRRLPTHHGLVAALPRAAPAGLPDCDARQPGHGHQRAQAAR